MNINHIAYMAAFTAVAAGAAPPARAQSSSLYVNPPQHTRRDPGADQYRGQTTSGSRTAPRRRTAIGQREAPHRLSPAIQRDSFSAVQTPQRRVFAVNDLVTIIVRESSETDFQAELETDKSSEHSGEIAEFPRLTLSDLADLQLRPNEFEEGNPQIDVQYDSQFEGEGDYSRSDEMTGRLTSRIIDVKPNGTLVLEARKFVESDDESFSIVATGTCRAEDITADNTVLSTQLYDLHLSKQHEGELRDSTEKGLITEVLDFLFNF